MPEQLTGQAQGMTADELIARLYAEQGYLVLASSHAAVIGEIYRHAKGALGNARTPLRIIGESSLAEYMAQSLRGNELAGTPNFPGHPGDYFYRVEAAD